MSRINEIRDLRAQVEYHWAQLSSLKEKAEAVAGKCSGDSQRRLNEARRQIERAEAALLHALDRTNEVLS